MTMTPEDLQMTELDNLPHHLRIWATAKISTMEKPSFQRLLDLRVQERELMSLELQGLSDDVAHLMKLVSDHEL